MPKSSPGWARAPNSDWTPLQKRWQFQTDRWLHSCRRSGLGTPQKARDSEIETKPTPTGSDKRWWWWSMSMASRGCHTLRSQNPWAFLPGKTPDRWSFQPDHLLCALQRSPQSDRVHLKPHLQRQGCSCTLPNRNNSELGCYLPNNRPQLPRRTKELNASSSRDKVTSI